MPKCGIFWYAGDTGTGKTSLAWAHLRQWAAEDKHPALIIDCIGSEQFAGVPHVKTAEQAIERVWSLGESVAIDPANDEEMDTLMRAALGGRRVHVLLDESSFYLDSRRGLSTPLMRLIRSHREAHACVTVQLTTQYFSGDIPSQVFACNPTFFIFRNSSERALERIVEETGLDPELVDSLPDMTYLVAPDRAEKIFLDKAQEGASTTPASLGAHETNSLGEKGS